MNQSQEQVELEKLNELIENIEREFSKVSYGQDNKLLYILVPSALLVIAAEKLGHNNSFVTLVTALLVIGSIIFTIYANISKKVSIAKKYGLQCHKCGHTPYPNSVETAIYTGICKKCGNKLPFNK